MFGGTYDNDSVLGRSLFHFKTIYFMREKVTVREGRQVVLEVIKFELTDEEMEQKRKELLEKVCKIDDLEEDKKEYLADHKAAIKPLKESKATITKTLRNGYEERAVEVYKVANDLDGTIDFIDTETGETLKTRRQRPDERVSFS